MVEGAGWRGSHTVSSTAEEDPGQVGWCGESLVMETAARSLHKDKDISGKKKHTKNKTKKKKKGKEEADREMIFSAGLLGELNLVFCHQRVE